MPYASWQEEFLIKQQEKRKISSAKSLIRKYEWFWLAGLVIATLILGIFGFWNLDNSQSLSNIIYNVMRLFILDNEFTGTIPLELEIARFMAPSLLAYAGLKAFLLFFQENIQVFRLKYFKNHVVICGLGEKGFYLAQDFINNGNDVVIIEKDSKNEFLPSIVLKKAIIIVGDATDKELLQEARVHFSDSIIIVCGDDGVNVEIAVHAYNLVNSQTLKLGDSTTKVKCYVHLVNLNLRAILKRHAIFTNPQDVYELDFFNSYENAARLLFRKYPIDRIASINPSTDQIHLIVIGLGKMGQNILIQAAKVCQYATSSKIRITVVDREAEMKVNSFKRFNPHFTKVVDLYHEKLDVLSPNMARAAFLNDVNSPSITIFIICLNNDAIGLTTALTLSKSFENEKTPILVRMEDYAGLATLLYEYDFVKEHPIYPFGMTRDIVSREILLKESLDSLAKIMKYEDDFEKTATYIPDDLEPIIDSWASLSDNVKESTRHQADHLEIKLRNIDCIVEKVENRAVQVYQLTSKEVEELSKLEHARWMAERRLDGWTHTKGEENINTKTSPYLVPWNELPEKKKGTYRQLVRKIPELLADYGLEIQKLVPYNRPTNLPPVVEHLDFYKGSKEILLLINILIASKQISYPQPISQDLEPEIWIKEYQEYFSKITSDSSLRKWIKERLDILINGPRNFRNLCLTDVLVIVPPLEKMINPLFESLQTYGKAGIFKPKGSGKSLLILYLALKWIIKFKTPILVVEQPKIFTKKDWERLETRLTSLCEIYGYEKKFLIIFENLQQLTRDQLIPFQRIISLISGMPISLVLTYTTENSEDQSFSDLSVTVKHKQIMDQLIYLVQTPKLSDYFHLSNTWNKWQEYFKEWASFINTMKS
jgi:voltage-gated potassium channel Kch